MDATTGQNGLQQARQFTQSAGVTGIVLTKLDGTAKGGVVVAISRELGLPVRFVGVGEKAGPIYCPSTRKILWIRCSPELYPAIGFSPLCIRH
jgi:signal recognition particle GTPase